MEDYSSSSEDQSEDSFRELPLPTTGRLRELVRTMLDEEIPGLYNDPRLIDLVEMDEEIASDEELQHRLDELIGVTNETDEDRFEFVSASLLEAALGIRRTGLLSGNDNILMSINKDNSISKFNPGEELDAPPCQKLIPAEATEKWNQVANETIELVLSSGLATKFTINDQIPEPLDGSDFYFFNDHNVLTDKVMPHAVIYARSDSTMGFQKLLNETTRFPLLVIHLAKTIGHGCYHVRNNYPLVIWNPDEWQLANKQVDRFSCFLDLEVDSVYHPLQFRWSEQRTLHKQITVELISYLKQCGFIEKSYLQLTSLMYKLIRGHDAYIYVTYRDSYIFCPEEVRQDIVDILVAKNGVYLGKAKELYGFDLVNSFGDYFVSADTLVSKASLVHPLATTFEFGQPSTPMDKATYQELISAPAEKGSIPANRRIRTLEEKIARLHHLMSHLSSTIRPDLKFCVDAVYWNSTNRPNSDPIKLNFEAFRTTLIYLMHTSESSMRFSLPPTKFSEWHVDCYLAYHPKADTKFDGCSFVLMLNSEPLYWCKFNLERYRGNEHEAIRLIAQVLNRTEIFRFLNSVSGTDEIAVRYISDMSMEWLEEFRDVNFKLRAPTLVCVEPQDNMALFLIKGAFGDSFKKQLRAFCII